MPHLGEKTFIVAIAFILFLTMTINVCFVVHFWRQYQSKMETIQNEIKKMKLSMKVDYQQLSNLYTEDRSCKPLEEEFDTLMNDTFKSLT